MKQLPFEIFFNIFPFLHQEEKLECMLVCKSWKDAIQESYILETVRITSTTHLKQLMQRIKEEPTRGDYIKRLVIDTPSGVSGLDSDFLTLLPSLRFFILTDKSHFDTFNEALQYPFRDSIEYISDLSKIPIAAYFLQKNFCPNLTTLTVQLFGYLDIQRFENTPSLKSLTMYSSHLYLQQFEYLHDFLPSLEVLKLIEFRHYANALDFDMDNVQPATSLTTFHFVGTFEDETGNGVGELEMLFLRYIRLKYSHLTEFRYEVPFKSDRVDTYRYQWDTIFQGLGSRITTMYTGKIFRYADIFHFLDNTGCCVNRLSLDEVPEDTTITSMLQSNQINYIQTLELKGMDLDNFEWLKNLRCLKKLKLTSGYQTLHSPTIDLNKILTSSPTSLKSLSFDYVNLAAECTDTINATQIESLSFFECYFPEDMDDFISQYFPSLTKLKLVLCCLREKTFRLSSLNLAYLKVYDAFAANDRGVFIVTHGNGERRWFIAKDNLSESELPRGISPFDVALFPAAKSYIVDQLEDEQVPFLTIECNSLRCLFIHI